MKGSVLFMDGKQIWVSLAIFLNSSKEELRKFGDWVITAFVNSSEDKVKEFTKWIRQIAGIETIEAERKNLPQLMQSEIAIQIAKLDLTTLTPETKIAIQDAVAKKIANIAGEIPEIVKKETEKYTKIVELFQQENTEITVKMTTLEKNFNSLPDFKKLEERLKKIEKKNEELKEENQQLQKRLNFQNSIFEELKKDNLALIYQKTAKELGIEINSEETKRFVENFKVPYEEREKHIKRCLLSIQARRHLGYPSAEKKQKYEELIEAFINEQKTLEQIKLEWEEIKNKKETIKEKEDVKIEADAEKIADIIQKTCNNDNNNFCIICGQDKGNNKFYCSRECMDKKETKIEFAERPKIT